MEQNTPNTTNGAPQVHRPYAQPKSSKGGRFSPRVIAIVAAVIFLVALAGLAAWKFGSIGGIVKKNQYQAVFLTNGQVYFGKLQNTSGQYLRLTDVYYLQATDVQSTENKDQKDAQNQATQQLIKLGNEIHGPENEMIVSREQVLFFENIKADGTVGKAIQQDKNDKKN